MLPAPHVPPPSAHQTLVTPLLVRDTGAEPWRTSPRRGRAPPAASTSRPRGGGARWRCLRARSLLICRSPRVARAMAWRQGPSQPLHTPEPNPPSHPRTPRPRPRPRPRLQAQAQHRGARVTGRPPTAGEGRRACEGRNQGERPRRLHGVGGEGCLGCNLLLRARRRGGGRRINCAANRTGRAGGKPRPGGDQYGEGSVGELGPRAAPGKHGSGRGGPAWERRARAREDAGSAGSGGQGGAAGPPFVKCAAPCQQ